MLLCMFIAQVRNRARDAYPNCPMVERLHLHLLPFDPGQFSRSRGVPRRWFPAYPKPNCPDFRVPESSLEWERMTVRDAGLCQFATLMLIGIS
jgi:hypothetical protein